MAIVQRLGGIWGKQIAIVQWINYPLEGFAPKQKIKVAKSGKSGQIGNEMADFGAEYAKFKVTLSHSVSAVLVLDTEQGIVVLCFILNDKAITK